MMKKNNRNNSNKINYKYSSLDISNNDVTKINSPEELYFSWYLDELLYYNIIDDYLIKTKPFELAKPLTIKYIKKMKRVPDKIMEQNILQEFNYTPDFVILWNKNNILSKNIFYDLLINQPDHIYNKKFTNPFIAQNINNKIISIVEIKPKFDYKNMTRLVINNIKTLYKLKNIFVNKIVCEDLFKKTFTPERYLFTNSINSTRNRLIRFKIKNYKTFINENI